MGILIALLIIAAIAGAAFFVLQRRPGGVRGLGRERTATVQTRAERVPRSDSMTAAVVDHAAVTDPRDVPAAEARLRAQARHVAARMQDDAQPGHDRQR